MATWIYSFVFITSTREQSSQKLQKQLMTQTLPVTFLEVPGNWQDQYELSGAAVPQKVWKVVEALECIEKAFLADRDCEGHKTLQNHASPPKRMVLLNKRVPRRYRANTKHCTGQKHGDMCMTDNQLECSKSKKDNAPQKLLC